MNLKKLLEECNDEEEEEEEESYNWIIQIELIMKNVDKNITMDDVHYALKMDTKMRLIVYIVISILIN